MDPGFSQLNPATSLNFDAVNIINGNEEEEAAEDAQIKQNELKELLADAFNDLIDDSFDSDCKEDANNDVSNPRLIDDPFDIQTSTPVSNKDIPNLKISHHLEDHNQNDISERLKKGNSSNGVTPLHPVQMNNHNGELIQVTHSPNNFDMQPHTDFEQNNYLNAEGQQAGPNNVTQLQILNRARERQIQNLNTKLDAVQDELQKEMRIHHHELQLKDGEMAILMNSLEEVKEKHAESHSKNLQLETDLLSQNAKFKAVIEANFSLESRNQVLEKTIDSMEKELKALQLSDNMTRAREHHNAAIEKLKENHQREIFILNQKCDAMNDEIESKNEELDSLTTKFNNALKQLDHIQLEKSEIINKLTRSLENSQKQCQGLLESESNKEFTQLKVELKKVTANKEITEKLLSSCQEEIQKLKDELKEKESDRLSVPMNACYDNTMSELISKSNSKENLESDSISKLENEIQHLRRDKNHCEDKIKYLQESIDKLSKENEKIHRCSDECTKRIEANVEYAKKKEEERCNKKLDELSSHYEDRIVHQNKEIASNLKTIDELKNMYIAVCEEKSMLMKNKREIDVFNGTNYDQTQNQNLLTAKLNAVIAERDELIDFKNHKFNDTDAFNRLKEKTSAVEKELVHMLKQKQKVESELEFLKADWKREKEALKNKYAQDLSATVDQLKTENSLEIDRIVKDIKSKSDNDYESILKESNENHQKYNEAKVEIKSLEKKLAQFDSLVARIHDSFQVKLRDALKDKDFEIKLLNDQLIGLKSNSSNQNLSQSVDSVAKCKILEDKVEELKLKVKKCQKYAIAKEKMAHGEVVKMKTEFAVTVENMHDKFNKLLADHEHELFELKVKHQRDLNDLKREHCNQLENLKKDEITSEELMKIRRTYIETLYSVKNEVMQYIRDFNKDSEKELQDNLHKLAQHVNGFDQKSDEDIQKSITPLKMFNFYDAKFPKYL